MKASPAAPKKLDVLTRRVQQFPLGFRGSKRERPRMTTPSLIAITWRAFRSLASPVATCAGLLVVICLWLSTGISAAMAQNSITGMRVGSVTVDGQSALRLVVETQVPAAAKISLLEAPYRLVLDLPETEWMVAGVPGKGSLSQSPASTYRFGSPSPGIGRLVVELDSAAAPVRAFALPPSEGGHRMVIDLLDRGVTAFRVAAGALRNAQGSVFETVQLSVQTPNVAVVPAPKAAPEPKDASTAQAVTGRQVDIVLPTRKPTRWVVFIDPGHGGKDPGAIGKSGTYEKDITLAAAQALARQLRNTGRVTALLTRSDDRYLKLRQRIQIARDRNADLFVSLHADSAHHAKAHGISVFTLSDKASDKEAAALARKENKSDLIGGPDLGVEDPEAANELLRMFQRESMNQSTYFAASILREIQDLPGGDRRGHRFAGFAVLKAPDIPSVLVEMGFLSNRKDEANLNKKSYREKLAVRLRTAIINYLEEYGPELQ